jgi:hypothetical protein
MWGALLHGIFILTSDQAPDQTQCKEFQEAGIVLIVKLVFMQHINKLEPAYKGYLHYIWTGLY